MSQFYFWMKYFKCSDTIVSWLNHYLIRYSGYVKMKKSIQTQTNCSKRDKTIDAVADTIFCFHHVFWWKTGKTLRNIPTTNKNIVSIFDLVFFSKKNNLTAIIYFHFWWIINMIEIQTTTFLQNQIPTHVNTF